MSSNSSPPRWLQGWGPRDIDTLVAKVLMDYVLWFNCESHLDVGANTTPYIIFSRTMGLKTTRCDVKGYTSDCVLGALPHLPFKSKSFDIVSCIQVLEHLHNPEACVKDLCNVARKVVITQVPNGLKSVSYADPTHINHFTISQLNNLVVEGWDQRIFASNIIATRLPHGANKVQDVMAGVFTHFYANNFFMIYTVKGLKPKVRSPGLLTNI